MRPNQVVTYPSALCTWRHNILPRSFPIHPFLFALYPVLSLLSQNIGEVQVSEAFRSTLVVLIGAAFLLLTLRMVIRNWQKAAILTSFYMVSLWRQPGCL